MSGTNETRVVNETTGGMKGSKDEAFSLLPWEQLAEVARLYNFGAIKYDRSNWMLGYDWHLSYDSLIRHANAWWNGEFDDDESKCDHMSSVVFHALALMYFRKYHPDLDDRNCTVLDQRREAAMTAEDDQAPRAVDLDSSVTSGLGGVVSIKWSCGCDSTLYCHECRPDLYEKASVPQFEIQELPADGQGHRREIVSAAQNPLDGRTAPLEPSEPHTSPEAPAQGHIPTNLCSVVAKDLPRSAVITQQVTCSLDEYRQIKAFLELP